MIAQSFAAGLAVGESEVGLLGVVPTPVLAFSTREGKYIFGFSCTASYNPPQFCGIKVFDSRKQEFMWKVIVLFQRLSSVKALKFMGLYEIIVSLGFC